MKPFLVLCLNDLTEKERGFKMPPQLKGSLLGRRVVLNQQVCQKLVFVGIVVGLFSFELGVYRAGFALKIHSKERVDSLVFVL